MTFCSKTVFFGVVLFAVAMLMMKESDAQVQQALAKFNQIEAVSEKFNFKMLFL